MWSEKFNADPEDLLDAYDCYIAAACESGALDAGWRPACVREFAESEYLSVWKEADPCDGGNPFDGLFACWDE